MARPYWVGKKGELWRVVAGPARLAFLVAAVIGLVSAVLLSGNPASTTAFGASQTPKFCDEFDTPTLRAGWSWVDPKRDSFYSLTANTGQLTLRTQEKGHDLYQNTDAPRMVQSVSGDFSVDTKVVVTPRYVFQGAGLLVWQEQSNYFWFVRSLEGISSIETANGQRRGGPATIRGIAPTQPVYLRIERRGNSFIAQYSLDGGAWQQYTRVSLPVGTTVSVGPLLMNEWQDNPIEAQFDYVRFDGACNPAQSASEPPPRPLHKVVVFLQGVGTELNHGAEKTNPDCQFDPLDPPVDLRIGTGTFACVKRRLTEPPFNYDPDDFLNYSYSGGQMQDGRWVPTDFSCLDVDRATMEANVRVLEAMLRSYAQAHREYQTEFALVGHSFGGLVAFSALGNLAIRESPDFQLKAVITLDSPLKGVSAANLDWWPELGFGECKVLVVEGFRELRDMGLHRSETITHMSDLADAARTASVAVYTLGNLQDCVYRIAHPTCAVIHPDLLVLIDPTADETDTQILERASVEVYDLQPLGLGGAPPGHGAILSDPGMVERVAGYVGMAASSSGEPSQAGAATPEQSDLALLAPVPAGVTVEEARVGCLAQGIGCTARVGARCLSGLTKHGGQLLLDRSSPPHLGR